MILIKWSEIFICSLNKNTKVMFQLKGFLLDPNLYEVFAAEGQLHSKIA